MDNKELVSLLRDAANALESEEIEACAYGEREGLEEGMACECTGNQVDELRAIMVASDLFDPCYEGNEKRGAWLVWMPEHTGAPLQNYGKDEPPQANEISFPVFKKLLIKTIEKLRSAREEEEAKKRKEEEHRPIKELRNDIVRIKTLLVDKQMHSVAMKMRDVERHLIELHPKVFEPSNP